jgi:hypothetical protein
MTADGGFARSLSSRAENIELSPVSLEAIAEIRRYLDDREADAIKFARDKGATVEPSPRPWALHRSDIHGLRNGGPPGNEAVRKSAAQPRP